MQSKQICWTQGVSPSTERSTPRVPPDVREGEGLMNYTAASNWEPFLNTVSGLYTHTHAHRVMVSRQQVTSESETNRRRAAAGVLGYFVPVNKNIWDYNSGWAKCTSLCEDVCVCGGGV